ncbi:hypothetical protein [Psychrobacter sp. BI730]|uniref:hypothetical protein n=1 Tax=Psychrobacter sp. BI730 TaxID=2705463 RepID=UPI0015C93780|nr:hypothetical protein [Psychrobacter sp. BI730]NYR09616.1 hypothetical protein [Psychrobacter sp. BI730]
MEVYRLIIYDGWSQAGDALFHIDDKAEDKMTLWATELMAQRRSYLPKNDPEILKETSQINRDILKFKLTSCEELKTAHNVSMTVTIEKIM